jgi:hypothetical protein
VCSSDLVGEGFQGFAWLCGHDGEKAAKTSILPDSALKSRFHPEPFALLPLCA